MKVSTNGGVFLRPRQLNTYRQRLRKLTKRDFIIKFNVIEFNAGWLANHMGGPTGR
jgi:hypothetical protein